MGFGVSTAEHEKAVASVADGVVIGSAFERMIEENLDHGDLAGLIGERVREYKAATRRALQPVLAQSFRSIRASEAYLSEIEKLIYIPHISV